MGVGEAKRSAEYRRHVWGTTGRNYCTRCCCVVCKDWNLQIFILIRSSFGWGVKNFDGSAAGSLLLLIFILIIVTQQPVVF